MIGALVATMFVIMAALVIADLIPGSHLPAVAGLALGLLATAAIGGIIVTASRISVRWLANGEPDDVDPTFCRACGYNHTGNVSGTCPECGQGITET